MIEKIIATYNYLPSTICFIQMLTFTIRQLSRKWAASALAAHSERRKYNRGEASSHPQIQSSRTGKIILNAARETDNGTM